MTKSRNKAVRRLNSATGVLHHTLKSHSGTVNAIAFSPDGKLVASA
jgi:WD40 repeat protein